MPDQDYISLKVSRYTANRLEQRIRPMKKLLLSLFLFCFSLSAYSQTIRIATGEYPPYCSSSAKHKGFISHVVTEAFARQGYDVEYDFLPWKRAIRQTQNGDYDATSWWVYNSERAAKFIYSDALVTTSAHFFYVKSHNFDFDWKTLKDLDPYKVGVTRGYFYSKELTEYREANPNRFEMVNTDEQNIKRMLVKRIDLFPVDLVVGLELLRTRFGPNVIHQVAYHPRPLRSKEGFMLFPKAKEGSEKVRRIFNAGLKSMKEDGTYDQMMDNLLSGYYSQ